VARFDLEAALPIATGDISNICYKNKHFTYNCTVCYLQMEALTDVHCYLWQQGVREKQEVLWRYDHAYCSTAH
jgi:hypothetical protein